jgi:hypothetical protein
VPRSPSLIFLTNSSFVSNIFRTISLTYVRAMLYFLSGGVTNDSKWFDV